MNSKNTNIVISHKNRDYVYIDGAPVCTKGFFSFGGGKEHLTVDKNMRKWWLSSLEAWRIRKKAKGFRKPPIFVCVKDEKEAEEIADVHKNVKFVGKGVHCIPHSSFVVWEIINPLNTR